MDWDTTWKRDVVIGVGGQVVSVIGDGLAAIAHLWRMLQTTGSAAVTGTVAGVATVGSRGGRGGGRRLSTAPAVRCHG